MKRISVLAFAFLAALSASAMAENPFLAKNRQIVRDFYEAALNKKDFEAASRYLGPRYVQHNPEAADGREGLKTYVDHLREKFPNSRSVIMRSVAEGNYVVVHVHATRVPGERGTAIIDIFKLEDGKIVEHWDVVQPVPEKAANKNGMF